MWKQVEGRLTVMRSARAQQLIREIAGGDAPPAIRRPLSHSVLVDCMDDAWQSMQEAGAALLTAPGGSPILNPLGIKGCIAQVQGELRMLPIEELGSCDNALQVIGTQLRACDCPAL